MKIEIFTYATGRTGATYRVVVMKDGKPVYELRATPGTIVKLRNRENAKWSNIADEVYAGPIPFSTTTFRH